MNLKLKLETKKQKITALIIAIVSVILCVAIVLITVASCGGDSTGGQTVKKIVKKKIVIVEEPDTSADDTADNDGNLDYDITNDTSDDGSFNDSTSDDEKDPNTYYKVVDEDYDGPEEVFDVVDVDEYEVELEGNNPTPLESKLGFGFYSYTWGNWTTQFGETYGKEGEILNLGAISDIETARWCQENGTSGFWNPSYSFNGDEPTENWKQNVLSTMESFKVAGVWDVIEGFHFDEPMLKISGEQFKNMTKFLAENFPDKRIFPVFSTYEVTGSSPSKTFDPISYENCGYITDMGYDNYQSLDIDYYRDIVNRMYEQVGRKNVRFWVFPSVSIVIPSNDEEHLLNHHEVLLQLFKELENPGGIYLWSWKTWGTMTGFSELTDPMLQYKYDRLLNSVLEMSKEVSQMKYTYVATKN